MLLSVLYIPLDFCRRLDEFFEKLPSNTLAINRQTETVSIEPQILDQHLSFLTQTPAVWMFPLGVFAIGLRFREAIVEYVGLVSGLILNIFQSVLGKFVI